MNTEENKPIIIGNTYNKLKVLSLSRNQGNGKIFYNCECVDCKKIIEMRSDNIKKYGKSSKCDCNKQIEIGDIYGQLKILSLSRNDHGRKYYNCECIKCNDIIEMRSDNIKKYGKSSKCKCNIMDDYIEKQFGRLYVKRIHHVDDRGEKTLFM